MKSDPFPRDNGASLRIGNIGLETLQIPIGQMMLEARRSAQVARAQLAGDVKAIESHNAPLLETNRRARQILSEAAGTDKGDDRAAWTKWMVDLFGMAYSPQKSSFGDETLIEQVPIAYRATASPSIIETSLGRTISFHHACFAAGTPIQTMNGPRPIEDLLAGDDVLTQNSETGKLSYQPIVEVYHNPPNETFKVALEAEGPQGGGPNAVVATGIHRLWKAGKGWTMVRDLKPGDVLRTLGGTARIASVAPEHVQPVFNLKVAEGESYFVGGLSVLAHDNSTVEPVAEPFDAVALVPSSSR